MASLAEFARAHSSLGTSEVDHLQRLVASWGLLADLCFADLLLFVAADGDGDDVRGRPDPNEAPDLLVLGQMRPLTNQTLYRSDLVGTVVSVADRPLVARSLALGEIIDGEVTSQALKERVRALCIPVRHQGRTIAVVNRESAPSVRPSRRAGAHLRGGVQPLRPHDRGGRVPLRQRGGPDRGGAPRGRRRDPAG